jgi:hypothetical protein
LRSRKQKCCNRSNEDDEKTPQDHSNSFLSKKYKRN